MRLFKNKTKGIPTVDGLINGRGGGLNPGGILSG